MTRDTVPHRRMQRGVRVTPDTVHTTMTAARRPWAIVTAAAATLRPLVDRTSAEEGDVEPAALSEGDGGDAR